MRYLLEVACESVADAVAAEAGGADRVELCVALDLGGLTPSAGLFREVRATVRVPVCVMIRPRSGDFVYTPTEVRVMTRDVELFRPDAPAGFVFGVLAGEGRINETACEQLLAACRDTPAVFHRAFDRTPSAAETLDTLIRLGFRRVLTSGGEDTATAGAERIGRMRERVAGRIELLPCGKVRAGNIEAVVRATGCGQVHGSFAEPVPPETDTAHRGYPSRVRVSREAVAAARAELDRLSGLLSSPP